MLKINHYTAAPFYNRKSCFILIKFLLLSSQINKTQLDKIARMVEKAVSQGARVILGGKMIVISPKDFIMNQLYW